MRDHQTMAQVRAVTVSGPHSVFMVAAVQACVRRVGLLYEGRFLSMKCPICGKKGIEAARWAADGGGFNLVVTCLRCKNEGAIMDLYVHEGRRNREETVLAVQQVLEAIPGSVAKVLMGDRDA